MTAVDSRADRGAPGAGHDPEDAPYRLTRGGAPLVVSMPHVGTAIPAAIAAGLAPEALSLADTDWHLPRLYDFLAGLDATVLVATQSRYVIDLNRPPDGASLYPGMATTGLVPTETFRGQPLHRGAPPGDAEIAARRERFWQPYHRALADEIGRLRASHPRVVLWDAHSIASVLPRFFEGRLPDLNFGTADGASCDPALIDAVLAPVRAQQGYDWVLNGRYKGGHITRHHGRPSAGVHAIQLEKAQAIYMDESPPFPFDEALAARLRPLLQRCLQAALDWARAG
jgi:N-formylglutamate deformylase